MADQLYLRITVPKQDGKTKRMARSTKIEVLSSVGGVIGELGGVKDLGIEYPLDNVPAARFSSVLFELVMADGVEVDITTIGGPPEVVPGG